MVGPTGLVMVPIIAARSHRVRPIFALPRRNVRCWHATLKLLTRRFKPLLAIAHKKAPRLRSLFFMVGPTGFEPATPSPPAKCATRLRYGPTQKEAK